MPSGEFQKCLARFIVTGPRQVGKTTLLREVAENIAYVTLDDPIMLQSAVYEVGILEPPVYFYRDKEQNEIDILILENGVLYPIEVKKHADPNKDDVSAFGVLDKLPGVVRGPGGVVCMYDNLITLKGDDKVIPVKFL